MNFLNLHGSTETLIDFDFSDHLPIQQHGVTSRRIGTQRNGNVERLEYLNAHRFRVDHAVSFDLNLVLRIRILDINMQLMTGSG